MYYLQIQTVIVVTTQVIKLIHLPVAVTSVFITCTVKSVDDGLVRTSSTCTAPSSSSTAYIGFMKDTITSTYMIDTAYTTCTQSLIVK